MPPFGTRRESWRANRRARGADRRDRLPEDSDYGPDPDDIEYGLRDTAQAMHEAERAGIAVFCVSVDHAAHDYLRKVCAPSRYLVIGDVHALPEQLSKVYRRLTHRAAR